MYKIKGIGIKKEYSTTHDAKVGDLMRVMDIENAVYGHILLRNQTGFVSLTDPSKTFNVSINYRVEFLSPGDTIILTVS